MTTMFTIQELYSKLNKIRCFQIKLDRKLKKFCNLHYIQSITVPHRTSRSINVVNEGTAVY
ncbi:AGAP001089-PA [Anopheles gambiae str. PEST]|uniref:AGAP001089-PA n=2 Tax=gambiae species complex TaxID=44542 RepID=A0NFL5_ANOGA|nr:AGAP001089-PA [Anopheles gambiae str. PEST]